MRLTKTRMRTSVLLLVCRHDEGEVERRTVSHRGERCTLSRLWVLEILLWRAPVKVWLSCWRHAQKHKQLREARADTRGGRYLEYARGREAEGKELQGDQRGGPSSPRWCLLLHSLLPTPVQRWDSSFQPHKNRGCVNRSEAHANKATSGDVILHNSLLIITFEHVLCVRRDGPLTASVLCTAFCSTDICRIK